MPRCYWQHTDDGSVLKRNNFTCSCPTLVTGISLAVRNCKWNFTHSHQTRSKLSVSLSPPTSAANASGGVSCSLGGEQSLVRFLVSVIGILIQAQRSTRELTSGGPWEHRASAGIARSREDEYPGYARAQALLGCPAETVQCGEKGGRTDTGEGPERRPVHQFLHNPHPWPPYRTSRSRRRQRNMGQENRLSPVRHWLRGGLGQCLEISLLVLQKWRGWVHRAILID